MGQNRYVRPTLRGFLGWCLTMACCAAWERFGVQTVPEIDPFTKEELNGDKEGPCLPVYRWRDVWVLPVMFCPFCGAGLAV